MYYCNIRRAGVSAFGLSGTNCHVVLEEAPCTKQKVQENSSSCNLVLLSACSINGIMKVVRSYIQFLESNSHDNGHSLEDICYTLMTCKIHYPYRVSLVINNEQELLDKLRIINKLGLKDIPDDNIYSNYMNHEQHNERDQQDNTLIQSLIKETVGSDRSIGVLDRLGRLYVSGTDIDWRQLYVGQQRNPVELPPFPFDKNNYWVTSVEEDSSKVNLSDVAGLQSFEYITNNNYERKIHNPTSSSNELVTTKGSAILNLSNIKSIVEKEWGLVLGMSTIDHGANFFRLGGDSIIASHIFNNLDRHFNGILEITDIFLYPSIHELAEHIDKQIQIYKKPDVQSSSQVLTDDSKVEETSDDLKKLLEDLMTGRIDSEAANKRYNSAKKSEGV